MQLRTIIYFTAAHMYLDEPTLYNNSAMSYNNPCFAAIVVFFSDNLLPLRIAQENALG